MTSNENLSATERQTDDNLLLNKKKEAYFKDSIGTETQKTESLMRYMSRQDLSKLCCYIEAFRATTGVSGSIVECGVYFGNGLMTWAKLSAALEPYNYNSKVIGFDTFSGNKGLTEIDLWSKQKGLHKQEGGYYADSYDDLCECISIFDTDRPLNQFEKVKLVKGALQETAQEYVNSNPNLIVRILSLSVNLYEPTKCALKAFLPRMPKGAIIVPFTLNSELYPGVTLAVLEELGIHGFEMKTPPFYPNFNYIVL